MAEDSAETCTIILYIRDLWFARLFVIQLSKYVCESFKSFRL